MTRDQSVLLALVGLGTSCLVLLALVVLLARRLRAATARSQAEVTDLHERLERLEAAQNGPPAPPAAAAPVEFVITDLGGPATRGGPDPEPVHLDGPAFADIVVKETVVKAASLVHGVRRGLDPATRNRIRFQMKQEVRRSRKQRKADLKAAQRDLHARQRSELSEEAS